MSQSDDPTARPPTPRTDLFGHTRDDVAAHAVTIGSPAHLRHMARGVMVWLAVMSVGALILNAEGHQLPVHPIAWLLASALGLAAWMWVQEVYTAGEHGRRLPGLWLARTIMIVLLVVLSVGVVLVLTGAAPQVTR